MKHTVLFALAATAILLSGCAKGAKFTVKGDLSSAGLRSPADSVALLGDQMARPLTAPVREGDAFVLTGRTERTELAKISIIGGERRSSRLLILEKGDITFQDGMAQGTPQNDSVAALFQRFRALRETCSREEMPIAVTREFSTFIQNHADEPCGACALLMGARFLAPEKVLELIQTLSPENRNIGDVHALDRRLKMFRHE